MRYPLLCTILKRLFFLAVHNLKLTKKKFNMCNYYSGLCKRNYTINITCADMNDWGRFRKPKTASVRLKKVTGVTELRWERHHKLHNGNSGVFETVSERRFNQQLLDGLWQLLSIPGKSAITLMDEWGKNGKERKVCLFCPEMEVGVEKEIQFVRLGDIKY